MKFDNFKKMKNFIYHHILNKIEDTDELNQTYALVKKQKSLQLMKYGDARISLFPRYIPNI